MKIAVMGEKDFMLGFEVGGVKVSCDINDQNYVERFEEYFDKKEIGIIIMDEKFYKKMPGRIKKKLEKTISPVVISISPEGSGGADLSELIKRCLGVDLWKE